MEALSMDLPVALIVFIIGLIVGSFLSVCIYRIPLSRLDRWYSPDEGEEAVQILSRLRKDMSIITPARSFCPVCNHQLRWYENIPLLSWIYLRGKCGSCRTPISFRYPAIELLTGLFAVAVLFRFGTTPTALLIFGTVCLFIVITFIDFDYYVIPDEISIRGSIIALAIALANSLYRIFEAPVVQDVYDSLLGILCGAGLLYLIYLLYYLVRRREGLGLGDVKLLFLIGCLFGPEAVLYTIFAGSLIGSVVGLVLVVFGGRNLSSAIPFGPYLTTAAILYIFTGSDFLVLLLNIIAPA